MQLSHHNNKFRSRHFPIVLVCDNIIKAPNIGSLFRIADAFGIEKLIFCGPNVPLGKRMTKTSRATEKVVTFEQYESAFEIVTDLKSKNYAIISLEISSMSIALPHFSVPNQPIALIIGDENHGISNAILEISDAVVHIDMFGQNSSMNVVQATSIALYEFTKQLGSKI